MDGVHVYAPDGTTLLDLQVRPARPGMLSRARRPQVMLTGG